MNSVLFLHDTSLATPRGAELTIKQLIRLGEQRQYSVTLDYLRNFDTTKRNIQNSDLIIVCSITRCQYELELINYLISSKALYIKIEYDYNFCVRRNILCTVDRKVTNCCNPDKFHHYRNLYANAKFNAFQSPSHYRAHVEFFGDAVSNHMIKPPTVHVEDLQISEEKIEDTIPFFGDLNYLKGGYAYVEYAKEHPNINFTVYGENKLRTELPSNISFHEPIPNKEVLKILGKTKTFICQPVWPEPSGRLAAEAFLSGCNIISNDRIGTFSFDFYPNNRDQAIHEMKTILDEFWDRAEQNIKKKPETKTNTLGKVLVYKSYGGLGDIFFSIPAIKKLAKVSDSLHFAVAPRLVDFFTNHLEDITVVNEEAARQQEDNYDNIYELGNYPAFRGYDLPHALKYPTHKKVKQHSIAHYIDTVSKLHKDINNSYDGFPYFETSKENSKYYVLHHGAGFLLKIWPTEKYAQLIETLSELFPTLNCKIIKGPNDPDIESYFTKPMPHVEYITGGMTDVGNAMAGALFHIGNDAGITHVAGAYNVPTVGIYGPTGPGSWGSFSENNEIIWGKKGVCNIRCNYDVILNCDHKVCLNSITVNRVVEAIYKLLQKTYPELSNTLKVNPQAVIDFSNKDCLIKLYDNEFLLEYHNDSMKNQIEDLLQKESVATKNDMSFNMVLEVLKQQHIIFNIPSFS
ncbi:hypothetical protein DMZ43_01915 [Meridianimaribacter sp. CL38]|uniref:glycosyltransferase family 9 protein n=1 Tax=Meridianimaribacter sp. CL38 TaxID=2213021 RepID=UPI00103D2180|nr:glycosyltransferase family 9 protein [Meridianimaribacter sp. CL38]TBV27826.1 hypothetical protein DMZ43_01915 [Meridianimaribacter sp. CL38]